MKKLLKNVGLMGWKALFEIQKEFFWWRRHRIRREEDSSGGTAANCHKNTGWWFWKGGEVFKAGTFSTHRKEEERRKQKEEFTWVIRSGQRKWESSLGLLGGSLEEDKARLKPNNISWEEFLQVWSDEISIFLSLYDSTSSIFTNSGVILLIVVNI